MNTNLLFFEKGNVTREVWYYELPLPEGMKQYTKGRPIRSEEFEPVKEWWNNRIESEHAWKVTIKEIQERNYNLVFKNPSKKGNLTHRMPEEIVRGIEEKENSIRKILGAVKKSL